MIEQISLHDITKKLHAYLDGEDNYGTFRSFIYHRYESDNEVVVDEFGDKLLSVLAPYVETETAIPDNQRSIRLRRLAQLLRSTQMRFIVEVAVYALNFDEIAALLRKRDAGIISNAVFKEQIRKLSPASFDVEQISRWAEQHTDEAEPHANLMR